MKICPRCFQDNYNDAADCYSCGGELKYVKPDQPQNAPSFACPRCGCNNIMGYKKGYSAGKGCLVFVLLIPFTLIWALIGLLAGAFGANKIKRTCLQCKYTW